MQLLLASAKLMHDQSPTLPLAELSEPAFEQEARCFVNDLKAYTPDELQALYQCNETIARQNHARFAAFERESATIPALFAYNGQAYKHLNANTIDLDSLIYAQSHLWIVSFLYGLLRPLDGIHPYRLEGRAELATAGGKTLFEYWRPKLTELLVKAVKADDGCLVWLAPDEFTHLVDWKRLNRELKVVRPVFQVEKDGKRRTQAVWAKTCRGAMARMVLLKRISRPEDLPAFAYEGFHYEPAEGDQEYPLFVRFNL